MEVLRNNHIDISRMMGMLRNTEDRILLVESESFQYELAKKFDLRPEEIIRVVPFYKFMDNRKTYQKYKTVLIQNASKLLDCLINEDQEIMAISV